LTLYHIHTTERYVVRHIDQRMCLMDVSIHLIAIRMSLPSFLESNDTYPEPYDELIQDIGTFITDQKSNGKLDRYNCTRLHARLQWYKRMNSGSVRTFEIVECVDNLCSTSGDMFTFKPSAHLCKDVPKP
jgi:hypothetical protein